jgi:sporulation protein YlmC with PRC-barrel domain
MNRTPKRAALALVLGVAVALPGATVAADRPSTSSAQGATAPAADARVTAQPVRLSRLMGMKVVSAAGKNVGTVKDVILDTDAGRVHYAVLSVGGLAGIGDRLFAIPLAQLKVDGRERLVLPIDKEELKSEPSFESESWPNWNEDAYGAKVDHYGAAPVTNGRFRRASDVMKAKVRDSQGGAIGNVEDMVIDLHASRVDYVVVKFDRAWNPNDKLVALPSSAFSDGAAAARGTPGARAAAPPRNPPPVLALESSEPTKGTASAVNPPGAVQTQPAPIDPGKDAKPRPLEREPLKTTTSYADDETLVFKGAREDLINAPAFDAKRLPE